VTKVAECLEELDSFAAERILRVTRLRRLGGNAPELLMHYLARFGAVDRVLEVNPDKNGDKAKVSNMVYVVMSSMESATACLAAGSDHEVLPGTTVLVRDFQRRSEA
jgi:hypothetical protein